MTKIDKVAWICIRDRRMLCVRSRGKDLFYVPGGKRELGESDEACLRREVREELSASLMAESTHWLGRFEAQADGKPEGTLVAMACYGAEFNGGLQANAEIAEYAWLSVSDRDRCSRVTQLVLDWLQQRGEID